MDVEREWERNRPSGGYVRRRKKKEMEISFPEKEIVKEKGLLCVINE